MLLVFTWKCFLCRSSDDQEVLFDQILMGQLEFPLPYWDNVSETAKVTIPCVFVCILNRDTSLCNKRSKTWRLFARCCRSWSDRCWRWRWTRDTPPSRCWSTPGSPWVQLSHTHIHSVFTQTWDFLFIQTSPPLLDTGRRSMWEWSPAVSSREDKEALQHQPEGQRHHCRSVSHFCKSVKLHYPWFTLSYRLRSVSFHHRCDSFLIPVTDLLFVLIVLVSLCTQLDDSFSMQRSGSLDFYQHPAMYWMRYARLP